MEKKKYGISFWFLIWGMGIAGQLCWNMENQWFNTFVYAKIAKDPTIISWMVAISAIATSISTFVSGTISDRKGRRKNVIAIGYILWGIFTIVFGLTQYITGGAVAVGSSVLLVAGFAVVAADAIMSWFGSMGNDAGFNAWANDWMDDNNRGYIGAAMATQPVLGTIIGTVVGGLLVGSDDNYMRLFLVMGLIVIALGLFSLVAVKENPELKPNVQGSFWQQFLSVFNFKKYFEMKELVAVNWTLAVYFIAFNVFFTHLGNYMIYYLGFTADTMGLVEGIALMASMLTVIPASGAINKNKYPMLCTIAILLSCAGLIILGFFISPDNIDVTKIFNPVLMLGMFLFGTGYVVILQTLTVWAKQLYPADTRGQFEGVRIVFFVLIPMIVAPLISNPIIKKSGEFIDPNGFVAYLPTNTLFKIASVLVLATFIPLFFANKARKESVK